MMISCQGTSGKKCSRFFFGRIFTLGPILSVYKNFTQSISNVGSLVSSTLLAKASRLENTLELVTPRNDFHHFFIYMTKFEKENQKLRTGDIIWFPVT
jgi:hypothetical protein